METPPNGRPIGYHGHVPTDMRVVGGAYGCAVIGHAPRDKQCYIYSINTIEIIPYTRSDTEIKLTYN